MRRLIIAAIAAIVLAPSSAIGAEFVFAATLGGNQEPTITGSQARGNATVRVNTDTQTIDMTMTVKDLSLDDLSDHIIHSAMGPVHIHLYKANGEISLILPFPFGESYAETADGFTIRVSDYRYADGAAILRSDMTFDQFVEALESDFVYLNVHTDAFAAGEISGRLAPRQP